LIKINYNKSKIKKKVEESKTFRAAMGMLLAIGNALNGTDVFI